MPEYSESFNAEAIEAFKLIRDYAAYSHLYYKLDISLISDGEYDMLCKRILDNYERIKPYDINNYLDIDELPAGTGYHLAVTGLTLQYALWLAGKLPRKQQSYITRLRRGKTNG